MSEAGPIKKALEFIDKHAGSMAFLGAFVSMTLGAAYWLARGGAAALITSMGALSDQDVADALSGLPEYHARQEQALEDLAVSIQQIADVLEAYRLQSESVVDWAPEHSQRLTDAVGGCYAGQENCLVYFRGRRTQAGLECRIRAGRPRIVMPSGEEFPITFAAGFELFDIGAEFETMEVRLAIPEHIPPGLAGLVMLNFYAECPFAPPGEIVERETFRLLVEIHPALAD